MLDELDMMRGDDGMLDLKLVYPGTSLPDVRWKQSVNPAQRGASTLEGTFYTAVNKTVLWTKLFEQRGCTTAFDGTPTAVDAFFAPDGALDVDMARRKKKLWTEVDPTMELVGW